MSGPVKPVAESIPVPALYVKAEASVITARLPVAAVTKAGKQVVSDDSSATVTVAASVAVSALPVTAPVMGPANPAAVSIFVSAS